LGHRTHLIGLRVRRFTTWITSSVNLHF
jgi:hypothetical protein